MTAIGLLGLTPFALAVFFASLIVITNAIEESFSRSRGAKKARAHRYFATCQTCGSRVELPASGELTIRFVANEETGEVSG